MSHPEDEGFTFNPDKGHESERFSVSLSEQQIRLLLSAALDAVDRGERIAAEEHVLLSTNPQDVRQFGAMIDRLQTLRMAIGELQKTLLRHL